MGHVPHEDQSEACTVLRSEQTLTVEHDVSFMFQVNFVRSFLFFLQGEPLI